MLKLSENLTLPLDFVTERIAFLARTGAGKSGGMRVLFEQMLDAGQFCVFIDPKGDAWGIRAAGNKPGKPVLVIGGDHADIPLEPSAGKYLADFLVRERVSTVLDISDLGTTEMWKFVSDFGSRMYKLNRDVVHVFIDEVDMLAGQQYFDPHCLHAIQLIQNKGRNRGFGLTIASQRPQLVNNTVLNASGTYIVMQTIGDDGLKVVKRLLGAVCSKEVIATIMAHLPTLKNREAFVYSPQTLGLEPAQIYFANFQTFDSMKTPRPGEARQLPKSLADIDLTAIKRDMAETIEAAQAEDPKTLKKQIAGLEKEINELRKGSNSTVEIKEVEVVKEVPVIDIEKVEALSELIHNWMRSLDGTIGKFKDSLSSLHIQETGFVTKMLADIRNDQPKLPASKAVKNNAMPSPIRPRPASTLVKTGSNSGLDLTQSAKSAPRVNNGTVSGPQRKLLDTLYLFETMGVTEVKRSNLAAFAGVSPRSSGFEKNLSTLKNHSEDPLVEYLPGSQVRLTESGRSMANAPTAIIASNKDLLDAWCRQISNPQGVLLKILFDVYPDPMNREDIAACADVSVKSSGFEKNLSTLRSLGLIDYGPNKTVFATELLFPLSM